MMQRGGKAQVEPVIIIMVVVIFAWLCWWVVSPKVQSAPQATAASIPDLADVPASTAPPREVSLPPPPTPPPPAHAFVFTDAHRQHFESELLRFMADAGAESNYAGMEVDQGSPPVICVKFYNAGGDDTATRLKNAIHAMCLSLFPDCKSVIVLIYDVGLQRFVP